MVNFPQPPKPLFTLSKWLEENARRYEAARRSGAPARNLAIRRPSRSQLSKVPKDQELTLEEWIDYFSGKPVRKMPRRP
jgi:hypothetical protein